MSQYELISVCVAIVAAGIALLKFARSGKEMRLSQEANEISLARLKQTTKLSTPDLIFSCDTSEETMWLIISITLLNGGAIPTQIVAGEIRLHSGEYPNADQRQDLTGIKIPGRGEHSAIIKAKRLVVDNGKPGIAATEVVCNAVYSRPEQDNAEAKARYEYDKKTRRFVQKV